MSYDRKRPVAILHDSLLLLARSHALLRRIHLDSLMALGYRPSLAHSTFHPLP